LEIQLSRGQNWRSIYQEGRIGDPDVKRGELEIQLSRGENWRSSYQEWRIGDSVIKRGELEISNSPLLISGSPILPSW
jgi:hypothetical protein